MAFLENKKDAVVWMTAENISAPHGFTTRYGGVSEGIFASLNLGEHRGDEPDRVRENYRRICAALDMPPEGLVFSKQIHESTVRYVTAADRHTLFAPVPYAADGLITDQPDVPLIIFTADCVPILLHAPVRGAIGAVHAGWRGTVADITGEGVRQMVSLLDCRPENIRAAIGPCISACCFETGPEVPEAVRAILGADAEQWITPKGEKAMVDLKGINRTLLIRSGVLPEHIETSPECTACSSDKYWSHRVTKGLRGSQATLIMLKGTTRQ